MAETIEQTQEDKAIAGVFSDEQDAQHALAEFRALGIPETDIQVTVQVHEREHNREVETTLRKLYHETVEGHGLRPVHYEKQIRAGKRMIIIHNVVDPRSVIDIFDRNRSDINPDGSRNVRRDVVGMTAGAAVAASALGTTAAAIGGPVGLVAGVAAGSALGGAIGAAAGKLIEHQK